MDALTIDPIRLSPRVVVFDYGEVISREPSAADRALLVDRAGAAGNEATFWHAYWAHREQLDAGTISIAEYWATVGRDTHADWNQIDVHELWAIDHKSWLSFDTGTLRVLHALHEGGTRLALLSNAPQDFSGWLRHGSFGVLFEQVFVSGELRLAKPHRPIYEHVIAELKIKPSEFLFIDNRAENVATAQAVGGDGHVFKNANALESWLRGLEQGIAANSMD